MLAIIRPVAYGVTLLTSLANAGTQSCRDIPGADALFLNHKLHIVWVGEVHGTNEMPVMFGDLVCAASQRRRPIIVGLEHTQSEKLYWDGFSAEGTGEQRAAFLLQGEQWSTPVQDGRDSVAMLTLALRLRDFAKQGRILGIELIDPIDGDADSTDAKMADAVIAVARRYPKALVLIYTGNFHALKFIPQAFPLNVPPAASLLPTGSVLSINLIGGSEGRAWCCRGKVCGEYANRGVDHPVGIALSGALVGAMDRLLARGYDGLGYLGAATTASPPALAEALALIAPVKEAFERVAAEQATLPPAANDRERLERMMDVDQAGRLVYSGLDFSNLPAVQRSAAQIGAWAPIDEHDLKDQAALKLMVPKEGWFNKSTYGDKASTSAFLIVQHAVNNPDLMRLAMNRMAPLVASGEVDASKYALLYDRISLQLDHKLQRYGSQVHCDAGKWMPQNLEDPAHIDDRRKAVGLTSEAEYLKLFANQPCN